MCMHTYVDYSPYIIHPFVIICAHHQETFKHKNSANFDIRKRFSLPFPIPLY